MTLSRVIPSEEMDVLQDASDILQNIYRRAADLEDIIQDSMRDAQERGYEAGRAEALREMEEKLAEQIQRVETKLLDLDERIVKIVVRSVALILGDVPADERVRRIVRTALTQAAAATSVTVRVAPEEMEFVSSSLRQSEIRIRIAPDSHIAPGELVLEADGQRQQIGLADQLANLIEAIRRG